MRNIESRPPDRPSVYGRDTVLTHLVDGTAQIHSIKIPEACSGFRPEYKRMERMFAERGNPGRVRANSAVAPREDQISKETGQCVIPVGGK
jgi:hypothetical protein